MDKELKYYFANFEDLVLGGRYYLNKGNKLQQSLFNSFSKVYDYLTWEDKGKFKMEERITKLEQKVRELENIIIYLSGQLRDRTGSLQVIGTPTYYDVKTTYQTRLYTADNMLMNKIRDRNATN